MNKDKIYHLSHIDGDGYGCNLVLDVMSKYEVKIEGINTNNISSYNANYDYIEKELDMIIEEIEKDDLETNKLLLITDLNLKNKNYIEKILPILEKNNCKIFLIDHHVTSKEISDNYDWYNVFTDNCATKEFFNLIIEQNKSLNLKKNKEIKELELTVNNIDHYDLYKKHLSNKWLKGSYIQDLTFKIMNMFNYTNTLNKIRKIETYNNEEQINIKQQFIKENQLNIKYTTYIIKEVSNLLNKDISIVDIETIYLSEIYNKILEEYKKETNYPKKEKEISTILKKDFLTIEEKIIKVNNILFDLDNKSIKNINSKLTENDKNLEKILKDLIFKLNMIIPLEALPQLNNKIKTYIERKVEVLFEENSIDEINTFFEKTLRKFIIKEIKEEDLLNENIIKNISNPNIPNYLLVCILHGKEGIENSIHKEFNNSELNTKVKMFLNMNGTFFQHSSYSYNSITLDSVLVNLNTKTAKMSARSCNLKAGPLMKKIDGGGGHNDAGGSNLIFSDFLTEKEIYIRDNKNNHTEEEFIENEKIIEKKILEKVLDILEDKKDLRKNISLKI